MSDSILLAFLPLGHSTCLFGSGETDCHSGLWSSLSREGGREEHGERKMAGEGKKIDQIIYRSVPLIRPLRKYAPPLFSAKVPAQGSLTRYNAPR